MTDRRSVLQGSSRRGTRPPTAGRNRSPGHRRARGYRRAPLLVLAIVALAAGVLWLMDTTASGPELAHRPATVAAGARPAREGAAEQAAVAPPSYGAHPAPAPERVHIRLKLPLTAGLLFDVRTGAVLWQRSPARELEIASLTKMMTALVAVAHSRRSDRVLITRQATHFSGSGVGLLPQGKRVPLLPLLYGLMLPSGNDAAIALAQHVAGTESRFVAMMNARSRELGLRCTHFTSTSGIVDKGNHSCASELAFIAHLVLENPLLGRIVASHSAILPFPIKGGRLYLYNNNPLLRIGYPGADGVKTGFTDAAGQCLVAAARRGHAWLGVVLLHSGDTLDQAQTLLNAGFAKLRAA
jgi:serine-type D-Ala-D-Ala carboxypeptidase (penicillin-binding protein 5/6)